MIVQNNQLINNTGNKGACIYVNIDFNNSIITNNHFINNKAIYGGALYLKNTDQIDIQNNVFQNNKA